MAWPFLVSAGAFVVRHAPAIIGAALGTLSGGAVAVAITSRARRKLQQEQEETVEEIVEALGGKMTAAKENTLAAVQEILQDRLSAGQEKLIEAFSAAVPVVNKAIVESPEMQAKIAELVRSEIASRRPRKAAASSADKSEPPEPTPEPAMAQAG